MRYTLEELIEAGLSDEDIFLLTEAKIEDDEEDSISNFTEPPIQVQLKACFQKALDTLQKKYPMFQGCEVLLGVEHYMIPPLFKRIAQIDPTSAEITQGYIDSLSSSDTLVGKLITVAPVVPKAVGREFNIGCRIDEDDHNTVSINISSKATANYGRGDMPLLAITYSVQVSPCKIVGRGLFSFDRRVRAMPWFPKD